MSKNYYCLGLMSGTSMDGVDASIIYSNGKTQYKVILDKYFEYPKNIYTNLVEIKDQIKSLKDLKRCKKQLQSLEKKITIFHSKVVNEILNKTNFKVDFIGFHGQTILHKPDKKITVQLGDGKILSKLTKKIVIYNFRQNDLKNGGEGAPLTPIFHKMLAKKHNIKSVHFINIGGIINKTSIYKSGSFNAKDIGPGMCLIDKWIRSNSKKKYDYKGNIAKSGKINKRILEYVMRSWYFYFIECKNLRVLKNSFDIKFFEYFFGGSSLPLLKSLSLKDGAATLTEFTAKILLQDFSDKVLRTSNFILCGGGRKNNFLVKIIKKSIKSLKLIDHFGVNGDFVESQAFAYLAIRSYLCLPISFPKTTKCKEPSTGGVKVKNY